MSYSHQQPTYVGVPEASEEAEGLEAREAAARGLPPPPEEIAAVVLPAGDAVPALEDLLAGVVITEGDGIRIEDPGPIGVVAGPAILIPRWLPKEVIVPGNDGGPCGGEEEGE